MEPKTIYPEIKCVRAEYGLLIVVGEEPDKEVRRACGTYTNSESWTDVEYIVPKAYEFDFHKKPESNCIYRFRYRTTKDGKIEFERTNE